jgi:polysaccharide biosynthesis transport protein
MSKPVHLQSEWSKSETLVLDSRSGSPVDHSRPSGSEPVVLEYWRVLCRRRWTVIASTVGLVALAAAVSFTMTPRYKTAAVISVGKEGVAALGFKDVGGTAPADVIEYNMQLDAQVQILASDTIVLDTLKELHLIGSSETPVRTEAPAKLAATLAKQELTLLRNYQNSLEVTRIAHTSLVEIHFSSPNPQGASDFVNKLVQVFIEKNFQTRYESTQQVSSWLSNQLEDLKTKVQVSQVKLADFQKQNGILYVDDKQNIITQKLDELNRGLTSAQEDRMAREALFRATETGDPELVPGVSESPIIKELKDQQARVASAYAQATSEMGSAHPKVIQLKNELDQIDSALHSEFTKIAERNRNSFLIAKERENMLRSAFEQQKQAANDLNQKAIEYQILKHDVESNQQLYDGLSQKLKESGLSAGLESGNVRVVDYARVPFSPSSPNIPLNLALALIAGCIGGSTLAFVEERLDATMRTPREVENVAALPLIGVIPLLRQNGNRNSKKLGVKDSSAVILKPESRMALLESFRALRTSILMAGEHPPKVIMVTSALPDEGKTTTSINCAVVLAQKGARVLLVDADLRAPRIHEVLGLSPHCGLSSLLGQVPGITDVDAVVQYSRVPNLFVLPAGPLHQEPSQLLDLGTMKKKIAEWRKVFTYIVIDTPPVLAASDCLILSSEADSVLLTMLAGQTPRSALLRARDMLQKVNAKLAGVVVNGVDMSSSDFSPYGYYGYGDRTKEHTNS